MDGILYVPHEATEWAEIYLSEKDRFSGNQESFIT